MQHLTATVEQVSSDDWIQNNAHIQADVTIPLADGKIVLPVPLCVMNGFLWTIYLHFGIPITKARVFFPDRSIDKETGKAVYSFTTETVSRCTNDIYNELILSYKIKNHMEVVGQVWNCLNRFSTFADEHTREYQVSIDILSLAELCEQPQLKEIVDKDIDDTHGTKYAEKQFEQITKKLMSTLAQGNHVLTPFMRTKLLKRNQVPQMLAAYGTRSDIDDRMMRHAISASAMSGLRGVEDYAIESLSAKKAEYFNNAVIQKAQYFARRCRLASTSQRKLYRGSCGSTATLTMVIPSRHKYNFIGKYVLVDDTTKDLLATRKWPQYDDNSVELTEENIDRFVDRPVQMWSIFGCKHTDGFCEHCAGYMHQRIEAYVPEDIHPGCFYTAQVVSAVTQKILSAKHLIKTSSKDFVLPERTSRYFTRSGDAIVWQADVIKTIRNCKVRLESSCLLGPLNDLNRVVLPAGNNFSKIDKLAIVNAKGDVVDLVEVNDGTTFPYFSAYAMEYLRAHFKEIVSDSDYIDIPMKDFDFELPLMLYTATNDDMVTYVDRVAQFVMGANGQGICSYTSIQACARDFAELVYSKSDTSFFAIEVMLRCYLTGDNSYNIPVLTDLSAPVHFAGLSDVISNEALSTKLAFQGVKDFFRDPLPTLDVIGSGYGFYDSLFGYCTIQ